MLIANRDTRKYLLRYPAIRISSYVIPPSAAITPVFARNGVGDRGFRARSGFLGRRFWHAHLHFQHLQAKLADVILEQCQPLRDELQGVSDPLLAARRCRWPHAVRRPLYPMSMSSAAFTDHCHGAMAACL